MKRIPFNKPSVVGREFALLEEAFERGQLSGDGHFTKLCNARISELAHAHDTREQMIALMRAREKAGVDTVRNFVALTKQRFWNDRSDLVASSRTGQTAW